MKQMLVDNLPEAAHAGALDRARRTQRRIRKRVIEIFVDHRRLRDDLAVMSEGQDLAVRIDREKLGRQMLALRQVEIVAYVGEPLLLQGRPDLDGSLRQSRMVEFKHCDRSSLIAGPQHNC
jgi:hypothetical protein